MFLLNGTFIEVKSVNFSLCCSPAAREHSEHTENHNALIRKPKLRLRWNEQDTLANEELQIPFSKHHQGCEGGDNEQIQTRGAPMENLP